MGKHAGYRFALNQLTFPAVVQTKTPFAITALWSNVGVTPADEPVAVRFELRAKGRSRVVCSQHSQLDLERLLPASSPPVVTDTLRVFGRFPPGQYALSLTVVDPTGYRAPLALAITGRGTAGRYLLGEMTVQQGPPGAEVFVPVIRARS